MTASQRNRGRVFALVLLVGATGACATPRLDATEAARVAVHAVEAAGLEPGAPGLAELERVDLAGVDGLGQPRTGEVWMLELEVDGEPWRLGVDPSQGRVVRTFEPPGSELTERQAAALADHREHPAADRAARRTRTVGMGVAVAVLAVGYLVLRRVARRSPV